MSRIKLSVIIPCFNEEARLPIFQQSWINFLSQHEVQLREHFDALELIFVNDGSTDSTGQQLIHLTQKLTSSSIMALHINLSPNQGKGAALKKGILASSGDWLLLTDLDLSCPLPELFKLTAHKEDIVIASRALPQSRILKRQPGIRPLLGQAMNFYIRVMTGLALKDTQCGFKLLRGPKAQELAGCIAENRFAFDVELLMRAKRQGLSMREVAVDWGHHSDSKVSLAKDGLNMILKITEMAFKFRLLNPLSHSKPRS